MPSDESKRQLIDRPPPALFIDMLEHGASLVGIVELVTLDEPPRSEHWLAHAQYLVTGTNPIDRREIDQLFYDEIQCAVSRLCAEAQRVPKDTVLKPNASLCSLMYIVMSLASRDDMTNFHPACINITMYLSSVQSSIVREDLLEFFGWIRRTISQETGVDDADINFAERTMIGIWEISTLLKGVAL